MGFKQIVVESPVAMATEDRSLQMVPAAMVVEEDKALIEEENSEVEWQLGQGCGHMLFIRLYI